MTTTDCKHYGVHVLMRCKEECGQTCMYLLGRTKKTKTIDDIPEDTLMSWAMRLFGLGSLAWDYADTVLKCAAVMRLQHTKKLCRAVRDIKADYDRFRARKISDSYVRKEQAIGLAIEELCQGHLDKLHYGLRNEIARYGLEPESTFLVEAVQQCLTLIDAMKLYAKDCDRQIGDTDAHSIMPDHFIRLSGLISEFAGDAYNHNSEARRITAKIIYNELKTVDLHGDDGKVY